MTLATQRTGTDRPDIIRQALDRLGAGSAPAQFASLLYGDTVPDGLGSPSSVWLADNADVAFAFIAEKPRGGHKVRIRHTSADGPMGATVAVEILNDDMPFLVDSVLGELQARGLGVRQLLHPTFKTQRDRTGRLKSLLGRGDQNWSDGHQESYIAIYLAGRLAEAAEAGLVGTLSAILDEVRAAVTDWQPMLRLVETMAQRLEQAPPGVPAGDLSEAVAFLHWLGAGNFTFLGTREYRLSGKVETAEKAETAELVPVEASGLGVLRDPAVHALRRDMARADALPRIRHHGMTPAPLVVGRASLHSRVHRRIDMHYIGIKIWHPDGRIDGEVLVAGLFTSQAYTDSTRNIPLLRHKVETVLGLSGYPAASHDAKALLNVLETFPRDELFQIGVEDLRQWSEAILDLEIRPRVRVLARVDRLDRFVTVLVYAPRDRYNSSVREHLVALLEAAYDGRIAAFYPYFTDTPLVRVQFIVSRGEGPSPHVDTAELERQIAEIVRTWHDRLDEAIAAKGAETEMLLARYGTAFPVAYRAVVPVERALEDIARIERLGPQMPVGIDFYRAPADPPERLHAAVYRFGGPISLSQRVPLLENLGFRAVDERSYRLRPELADGVHTVTLHDMVLETADGAPLDLATHDERLEACFLTVFHGEADNDTFNRLIVSAGADWRSVAVLRAFAAYLRQLGVPFGARYIADTLHRHAGVAHDLLELFHLRFDPDRALDIAQRLAIEDGIRERIEGALAAVPSLDEDRILRLVLNLVGATVRTNFFQRGAAPLSYPATIAFKLDSRAVEAAPQPKPFREIWVYTPRVEGVHLRFAPIARGGIRWSDRAQDFRTEVLGLVRAQLVKNAVIVPSGAKGGFLPKRLPRGGSRAEVQKEGVAAYRTFISALLDMTDNIVDGKVVPPPRVVRHDGDDAYLVVAADKGTATFSDIANDISRTRGFWLGDAFASGGSDGYDHKGMGITARGAWECVKRHFREMDIDIGRQPFRVVGVGDMSGDVFGNGMLLSEHIRLVAAFDHRDIFIDPDPDPAVGFAERKRLFTLPRSTWQDYDKARISKGGGVFPRSAKAIPMSAQMQALFGLEAASLTPAELIRALLKCETDLLWFGGIGTYVRASSERDADVGDRANDALRVTAAELNAKVVGEGANLGMTQRARIELARRGGRVNTDFIDNSAGVNTSDQEVNIKIALQPAMRTGTLDADTRRRLLAGMTEDVAAASLRNNYQQSLALSLAERRSARDLPDYASLMSALEARGLLDRTLEALPSEIDLQARGRTGRGLTRPELAVLLSYAKIALQQDLLESRVPDEAQLEGWLTDYFPPLLRERYRAEIDGHSLRREIIALGLTNSVVNRGGPAMAVRLTSETGRPASEVAQAFMVVREVFDLPRLWQRIDALDGRIGGKAQLELYEATRTHVNDRTQWFLRHDGAVADLAGTIARHAAGVAELTEALGKVLPPGRRSSLEGRAARLAADGVPADLAGEIARLGVLGQAPAVTTIAQAMGRPVAETAQVYFELAERLRIDDLAARGAAIATADKYDRLAIAQALAQLAAAHAAFARAALGAGGAEAWSAAQGERLERAGRILADAAGNGTLTVSKLSVAAGILGDLAADGALDGIPSP